MLKEKILDDLKSAMKSQNSLEISVLRLILSAIKNKEIEEKGMAEGGKISEDDLLGIIRKEARKRKEAIQVYAENNRPELAEKEEKELTDKELTDEIDNFLFDNDFNLIIVN